MHKGIDFKRIVVFGIKFIIAILIAYSLPETAIENPEFANSLITIFSVFAGIMIALMALTSHLSETQNWKDIAVAREVIEAKLFRQELLFYGYLSTITLIVSSIILEHYNLWGYSDSISGFLKRMYTFIGMLSLFLSFSLPRSLKQAHEKSITDRMNKKKL